MKKIDIQQMKIKRYSFDLCAHMAVCDANYFRILKLLPELDLFSRREIALLHPKFTQQMIVILEVIEKFKYTSTVKISQHCENNCSHYAPPVMQIRMYHDAKTAEVLSYQNHRFFKSIYEVPNKNMYHPDEKEQLNRFLTEWLSLCLAKGLVKNINIIDEYLIYTEA